MHDEFFFIPGTSRVYHEDVYTTKDIKITKLGVLITRNIRALRGAKIKLNVTHSLRKRLKNLNLFVFGAEALFGALRQSLEISQPLLAPESLLAPSVGGQLLAEAGGRAQEPEDQLVGKIF